MKGDDVRLAELNLLEFTQVCSVRRGVDGPDSAGKGLRGIGFSRPGEHLRQKGRHTGGLVSQFLFRIASEVIGAGLVPYVPGKDAIVLGEGSHHAYYVRL